MRSRTESLPSSNIAVNATPGQTINNACFGGTPAPENQKTAANVIAKPMTRAMFQESRYRAINFRGLQHSASMASMAPPLHVYLPGDERFYHLPGPIGLRSRHGNPLVLAALKNLI